jgi:hypothetical protein
MSVPNWNASGDWFDVCKCNIPCPRTFAQASSYGDCEGVLAYHIKKGRYGDTPLEGFNVMMVGGFRGNIWAGDAKARWRSFLTSAPTKNRGKPSR